VWEAILVGAIVLLAALYAAWALLPAQPRLRLARSIAQWGRRSGRAAWMTRATSWLEQAALKRMGGCSDCGAVQSTPGRPPDGRSDQPRPRNE